MSYPPNPGYPQDPGYGQYPQQGAPGYEQYPAGGAGYGYGQPTDWYAGWGSRVGASLIDALIGIAIVLPFLIAGIATDKPALTVIGYVPAFGWQLYQLYLQGTTGASFGKKIVGIRVLREADGQPTGFGMAFVRLLAHILDAIPCYIGYLWPLWDAKKQTFADKVCGTIVIRNQ